MIDIYSQISPTDVCFKGQFQYLIWYTAKTLIKKYEFKKKIRGVYHLGQQLHVTHII